MEKDNSSAAGAAPLTDGRPEPTASTAVHFPVFNDHRGNRFVFPGVYASPERSYDWARCRMICAALGVTEEKDLLTVTEDNGELINFPHVKASAGHRGFLHGGDTVWLIGGPEFDALSKSGA